ATRETLLRGSDNGPVVEPGQPGASLLIKKIRHEHQPGMPYQSAKLPPEVIVRIEEWVKAGAPYDAPLRVDATPRIPPPGPKHWAFELPKAVPPPDVKNPAWARNPIDRFLLAA